MKKSETVRGKYWTTARLKSQQLLLQWERAKSTQGKK